MENKYMDLALKNARKAIKYDEVPVGCVIVIGENVIAQSFNRKEKKGSAIYHAEIEALIKAVSKTKDWRLDKADLYVTLEPCLMCVGAIIQHRIKNVYFGAYDPKGGAVESTLKITTLKGINHYPNFYGGIMANSSAKLLKDYFKNKRKK
jgi:tRNA(adenine34) deaminase